MSKPEIKHQDFFVIRTPRMPVNALSALGNSKQQTQDALKSWIAIPQVKEALYLASPSLLERIEQFEKNKIDNTDKKPKKSELKQAKKLELALLKYMIRMCSRPTPFGLFSGIFMGDISSQTKILSQNLSLDSRKTRLDMFYLSAIKEHFLKHNARSEQLKYSPNSSHYFIADHCRYIEAYQSDETRQYRLSAIERDEYFDFILDKAKEGLSFNQLVNALLGRFSQSDAADLEEVEAEKNDVIEYVQQLIDESILLADIPLPLTGEAPDTALINSLNKIGQKETADHISTSLYQLQQLDNQKSGTVDDYKKILEHLNQLPVKAQENKLFQSDIYRAFEHCELDESQISRLLKQLKLIKGLSIKHTEPFSDFISKFNLRFEGQYVPLDKLLDDESGISFSNETGYEAPLLAGLKLRSSSGGQGAGQSASILDNLITQEISLPQNRNKSVIKLSSKKLAKHLDKPISESDLPTSFAAMLSLYEDKETQSPFIKFNGCYGPSAANLLGRFCHLNDGLQQNVKTHLSAESAHSPDVIFAEIVHMPEGRPGNVIARPHLRQYEIVFLADSSLQSEFQIPISDLHVWVEGGQVKLWSKRLDKQVIPRLSSAHNYSSHSLSAYKFLSMLQHQGSSSPSFSMPQSQVNMSFVPRVMLDNLILSEKIWRIERKELEEVLDTKSADTTEIVIKKWQELKEKYQLDDHVAYAMSDNVLQLNLTNPLMLEILLSETKGQITVELKEVLTGQFNTPVKSSTGECYANELIIPFLNTGAKEHINFSDDPQANILAKPIKRRFSPGSEWLSLKVYSGNTAVETLLAESLLPLIEQCAPLYKKWFFIRYGDPDWHLRLRFFGDPSILCGQLLPKLNQLLDPMIESGEIHKAELFTYEREVERYGGPDAMALIEELFMADSQLVAKTVQLEEEYGEDVRWRIALLMTNQLLNTFDYEVENKLSLISGLRAGFGKEFNESSQLRKQLGDKYKKIQTQLLSDFSQFEDPQQSEIEEDTQQIFDLINVWQQDVTPVIHSLNALMSSDEGIKCSKDTLLSSLLHMHNNRMFKAYGREHELVMHDFLRRYYFSAGKRR
ncbi:lantibiotic dehydratase [Pseudoalteromonas denitrificans]|uniref:Thiopeptide-type bacteriocin biosynthesis domain-containing protein n=1 Tax=Pseudoalteromonas denitrificans DSM 6059 TaxID=1123010 RepID=A0A1I1I3B5_9GAMM|nr:lantibiotic dehydratase [Pseudoalteromonas denitrificans]SFC30807.1 thiopeptide-type bacteriocin biosynthesis domain-containing protein [Pseudoalteromonas denitrificans DSM 6059]